MNESCGWKSASVLQCRQKFALQQLCPLLDVACGWVARPRPKPAGRPGSSSSVRACSVQLTERCAALFVCLLTPNNKATALAEVLLPYTLDVRVAKQPVVYTCVHNRKTLPPR